MDAVHRLNGGGHIIPKANRFQVELVVSKDTFIGWFSARELGSQCALLARGVVRADVGLVQSMAIVTGNVLIVVLLQDALWLEAAGLATPMADVQAGVQPLGDEVGCVADELVAPHEADMVCVDHGTPARTGDGEAKPRVAFLHLDVDDVVVLIEDLLGGEAWLVGGVLGNHTAILVVVELLEQASVALVQSLGGGVQQKALAGNLVLGHCLWEMIRTEQNRTNQELDC